MKTLKNKKLVILLGSDFSHDSRVLKEAQSASRAGMKVTVLARKSFETLFLEKKSGFKVIRFQTAVDWFWSRISPGKGREVAGSQSAGSRLPNGLISYTSILNLWLLNRAFVRQTLKIKPDIIHATDSITLPAAYRLKKHGLKFVYDAHEFYTESVANPYFWWKKYYIWLERRLNLSDGIFSVCQSILDELNLRYRLQNVPEAILYNAPLYEKQTLGKMKRPIKILYLGNYQAYLDFSHLFKAIRLLDNVTLTTVGPGWPKAIKGNILSLNPVPPEKVIELATDYDIGVIPYVGDNLNNYFSTPNKLFQYMMAGLAIAGSDFPEIRRVVKSCQNGVLFNPSESRSIRQALTKLINNKEHLLDCKNNSLKYARQYCWENQEKKQLQMYEQIIEK